MTSKSAGCLQFLCLSLYIESWSCIVTKYVSRCSRYFHKHTNDSVTSKKKMKSDLLYAKSTEILNGQLFIVERGNVCRQKKERDREGWGDLLRCCVLQQTTENCTLGMAVETSMAVSKTSAPILTVWRLTTTILVVPHR